MSSLAARAAVRDRALAAAREVAVIGLAALAYVGVRAATESDLREAQANGRRILAVERVVHMDWEYGLQSFALGHRPLLTVANWVYIWGFWPVLAGSAVFLYTRHPQGYFQLRNAVFLSALVGFVVFAAFPVAPPRLVDPKLVDTILDRATWYRSVLPPRLTDEYAAMPSLHVGWILLVGTALARTIRRPAAYAVAILLPTVMALAVVVTANHYVADALVGSAVGLLALAAVTRLPWKP
jgi:membrane-associated phospholipid phosphatase